MKVLGDTDTGPRRGVGLTVADARHHLHVIGATGSGKSTLIANLILDDARAGRGVLLIDPKGDLASDLLDRLPVSAAGRLTLIDPDDPAAPPCLNPLDPAPGTDLDTAVDNLVGIFARIYTAYWGPRTDDVARAAALTLLHPRRTTNRPADGHRLLHSQGVAPVAALADIPRLLADPDHRARLVAGIDDEVLAGFWAWYENLSTSGQAAAAGPLPYVWGGNGPVSTGLPSGKVAWRGGFDCSELTQAAYAAAGIRLPRTAQAQYDAGPTLPPGTPLQPGDLLLYGTPTNVHHVGMYIGDGRMVDAPHRGSAVRVEDYRWPDLLAATRPSARG